MTSPRVELVYDLDCPNVDAMRTVLLRAFGQTRLSPCWTEWDRKAPESPAYVRGYGSPTLLVDGKDIAGVAVGDGADCCRVYVDERGVFSGVPPVEQVAAVLSASSRSESNPEIRWWQLAPALPGLGATFLPVLGCPACWPAYASVLGALGLGFLLEQTYLLPVVAVLLGLALLGIGYRANTRRGYGPLGLGVLGASTIMTGKFAASSSAVLYLGAAFFVGAALWNAWPRKSSAAGSCAACIPEKPVR